MIKYKHLWVWDTMMGSYSYWVEGQQQQAMQDNAPIDAIFRKQDKTWVRASDLPAKHHFWDEFKKYFPEFAWQHVYVKD